MPNGEIEIVWGDGEYKFNIAKIGQVLELEEKCDAGIATVINRLRTGTYYFHDFRETLRLGLIGAGMEPPKATALVRRYVDERPWQENIMPALAVLMGAMVGVPGDEVGKKPTADQTATETTNPETVVSSDPQSTGSARRSGSRRGRSTKSRSGSSAPASTATIEPTA